MSCFSPAFWAAHHVYMVAPHKFKKVKFFKCNEPCWSVLLLFIIMVLRHQSAQCTAFGNTKEQKEVNNLLCSIIHVRAYGSVKGPVHLTSPILIAIYGNTQSNNFKVFWRIWNPFPTKVYMDDIFWNWTEMTHLMGGSQRLYYWRVFWELLANIHGRELNVMCLLGQC